MQPASVNIDVPLDRIKSLIETDGLKNFFQVSHTKMIKWSEYSPTHTVGKIPYLRRKNLSAFRFHLHFEVIANGTNISISVEPTSFFYKNKWIIYLLGLMMCGIGIIFPVIGFSVIEQRIRSITDDIYNAVTTWSISVRSDGN